MIAVEIKVHYTCGTYVTNTLNGKRASSTSSAEVAARRLAEKTFGAAVKSLEQAERHPRDSGNTTWWRVVLSETAPQT